MNCDLKFYFISIIVLSIVNVSISKKHSVNIVQDGRPYIRMTSFGFYSGGRDC